MHLLDSAGGHVELDYLGEVASSEAVHEADASLVPEDVVVRDFAHAGSVYGLVSEPLLLGSSAIVQSAPRERPLAAFRERTSGLLQVAHGEIVVRFRSDLPAGKRDRLLAARGLEVVRKNPFVGDQLVATGPTHADPELLEICNEYVESEHVVFATPNFISEYRREAGSAPTPPPQQWHLNNLGSMAGQIAGEDVGAIGAWKTTSGRSSVVVAVLDDGVDIDHPDLCSCIWRNPDGGSPDLYGRDFFLPDEHPDHYNPRPKQFVYPYNGRANDNHGTACAGLVAAAGGSALGVAFSCRLLPVKIFHGPRLADSERVANAIRYSAQRADVISCSWSGPFNSDIQYAIDEEAKRFGRGGLGTAVFCASGNGGGAVRNPAACAGAIAIGASTDQAERASYSNYGPELDLVAPSSGGVQAIFTTDVVNPSGRGYNPGRADLGGEDGLHTNGFGGTSAATPLAAGVAALVLSVQSSLDRDGVRDLLRRTADKIGDPKAYDANGHSNWYGYGRVNAERAVSEAADTGP